MVAGLRTRALVSEPTANRTYAGPLRFEASLSCSLFRPTRLPLCSAVLLSHTRTRQLDRQVERVDALRLTAGLDGSDETLTSGETRALAPPPSSDEEATADSL
jgi:hypothetical protein